MATLPSRNKVIQQIGGEVIVFSNDGSETEFARFDPADPKSFGPAIKEIWEDDRLTDEDKCFACFWAGYFYANNV